ncbi:MAG: 50S ribosomal protein L11 methyltransferase [Gammaproteobacteria bacterium]|nr:MAG: 50S ribosomal protein L11 methyltransferase [Gammaproteobacteria bacterium]
MTWVRLILEAEGEDPQALATRLEALGAASVTFEDAGDEPLLEPGVGETPLWRRTRVIGLFEAGQGRRARQRLAHALPEATRLALEPLPDRDWTRAWLDAFRPLRFGRRLWVVPSGFAPPPEAEVVLRLDPGLAFGTGTHPTTALCLEWLEAHPPEGQEVVDYGCGSGILAVAACLLGAVQVVAVDHDPQALAATRANAQRNRVHDRIQACRPEDAPAGTADLVLANILANPLIELAPRLAGRVRPGGRIVLSGILEAQAGAVAAAYAPMFALAPPRVREGWVCLEGVRKVEGG